MSGSFHENPTINIPATQAQGDAVMSSQSKTMTTISNPVSTVNSFAKMPVTTTCNNSLSQALRLGQSLQDFHNLPSLPFNVAYANPAHHGAYLFADNGFTPARMPYISVKEEKMDLNSAVSVQQAALQQRPSSRGSMSVPSPRPTSYSPVGDRVKSEKVAGSVLRTPRNEYGGQQHQLSPGEKSGKGPMGSLMLINVPAYQDGRHVSSPGIPTVTLNNHHSHHHQILRYPPNGDTLLSASAINYGDSEILPESGFDVSVGGSLGSLDDGLMSTNLSVPGTGGGGAATFDLFDGEAGQDSYMEGNQELQLSPHAFPSNAESFALNDGSNLSAVHDPTPDGRTGSENVIAKCQQSSNTLSVASATDKTKSKSRPIKATSPNRTGTQTCPVCKKVFSNSSALAKHKLTHSDERKYVCQLCTKAFKRQDHLNGHLLTHMNKKPYECKVEGCGKSYCDARSLRRHTENHHTSGSQSAAVAAAAATVNAIAVRVGAPLLSGTLPFIADGKIEANGTSFLASALQSDRIRYAPPPAVTRPSGVLPPEYGKTTTAATASTDSKINSSAATQLQLLAFQQQEHQSREQGGSTLPWPPPNTNSLYINSALSQPSFTEGASSQQQQQSSSSSSSERPSSNTPDMAEDYLGQSAAAVPTSLHLHNTLATSILAQHLKLNLPPQGHLSQESGTSLADPQLKLSDMLASSNLLHIGTPSQPMTIDLSQALQMRDQWSQSSVYQPAASNPMYGTTSSAFTSEPKPVECNICQRKFKNIPALNGHMRLHGGYLKKESDGSKKQDKKSESRPHHPPLQTASYNVRALIEEKIIQKRIVNPPLNIPVSHPQPSISPMALLPRPLPMPETSYAPTIQSADDLALRNPIQEELMNYANQPCILEQTAHPPISQHSQLQDQMPPPRTPPPPHQSHDTHHHRHHQHRHEMDRGSYGSAEDQAQSDMQRQIEIIKQGLMSNQPIMEKFRRHSDSDHFMTPRRPYLDGIDSTSLVDYLRGKVVGKRMQRTGSDPGEFVVGTFVGMFDEMDDECPSGVEMMDAGGDSELPEEELPMESDSLPPSEIMDFEISGIGEPLPPTISIPNTTTSILAATLAAPVMTTMVENMTVDIPCPAELNYDDNLMSAAVTPVSKVKVEEDDDVFLSPSSIPTSPIRTKKKHRPEPLYIPPQASTGGFQSRLRSPRLWEPISGGRICSPPPYTPPPMLSPVRSGPGLFWHVISGSGSLTPKSAPLTPSRLSIIPEYIPQPEEEEDIDEAPETDIQPHVNIGPQFQAHLPYLRSDMYGYNPKWDDLVWNPKTEESLTDREIEMYLQFACCAAVPGGGGNKEYALHVLHMAEGNIQDAMLRLMDPAPKLPATHPLLTYPYAESDRWSTEEIDLYQQALISCDKDFFSMAQEVKTKTVKQCVQFYYLWKKICPEEYKRLRLIRRKREMDGAQYNLRSKLDENEGESPRSGDRAVSPARSTDNSAERFVCDYPDCFASFASRQALNGHIRIHGGNTGPRNTHSNGNRSRSPANDDSGSQQYSPSTNPASNASTQFGDPVEEFPCKICGKVFLKVKSRSAHMKSHRPIDADKQK